MITTTAKSKLKVVCVSDVDMIGRELVEDMWPNQQQH